MTIELQLKKKDASVNLAVHPMFQPTTLVLKTAWIMYGAECVVTSANDGKHSTNSAHYRGQGLDLRINNIWGVPVVRFAQHLSKAVVDACGPYFFVVLESDHIHFECIEPGQSPNIKNYKVGVHFYEKASA